MSRQTVPAITDGSAVAPGAGLLRSVATPQVVIIGTGSETSVALQASDVLAKEGIQANVVSMPSWDRFARLPATEQERILPKHVPRISVEAASTFGWARYATHSVGIDTFGASAPGNVVMEKYGITAENVARVAREAVSQ